MNLRKSWLVGAVFSMLLSGCKEIHGIISFEKDGSGTLNLEVIYPESSSIKSVESCREMLNSISWNNISYEGFPSMNNPNGDDQCTYTYYFNDLDEVEELHQALGVKLDRLNIDNDYFIYKASNETCDFDFDPGSTRSATWSVVPPGDVSSHNAERIIGNKLIWNISGLDCYEVSVESVVTQPEESETNENSGLTEQLPNNGTTPDTSSSEEKAENQPLVTSIGVWTAIFASIATVIGTAIAWLAYKDSKKKSP